MGARRSSRGLTRRSLLRIATGATVGIAVGSASYGTLYERHHLGLTRATLPVAGLPLALEGLRIGLITDTHHSSFTALPFIEQAVALLQREAPDLVMLGGDYVTHRDRMYIPDAAAPFGAIEAPHGVFAVLGNHDDEVDVPRALRRAGVSLLADARTRVTIRGETVDIVGLRYWTKTVAAVSPIARGRAPFSILLAHDPRRLREASALGIPLVLSGHTHGGQISVPLLGPVGAYKFPLAHGLGRDGDTTIFVSRGVGTVLVPCRIDCPPEVAVLTLARPA